MAPQPCHRTLREVATRFGSSRTRLAPSCDRSLKDAVEAPVHNLLRPGTLQRVPDLVKHLILADDHAFESARNSQQVRDGLAAGQPHRLKAGRLTESVQLDPVACCQRDSAASGRKPRIDFAARNGAGLSIDVARRGGERPQLAHAVLTLAPCPTMSATSNRSSADSASAKRVVASRVSRLRRRATTASSSTNGLRKRRNPSTVSLSDAPSRAAASPYSPAWRSADASRAAASPRSASRWARRSPTSRVPRSRNRLL